MMHLDKSLKVPVHVLMEDSTSNRIPFPKAQPGDVEMLTGGLPLNNNGDSFLSAMSGGKDKKG